MHRHQERGGQGEPGARVAQGIRRARKQKRRSNPDVVALCARAADGDFLYFLLIAARIGVAEGIVQHIAVTIIALREGGLGDEGIGGEESADIRIVDPPVHMDETGAFQVLMAGVAALGVGGVERRQKPSKDLDRSE